MHGRMHCAMRIGCKRIIASGWQCFSSAASNTSSYLRNLRNGAEVRAMYPAHYIRPPHTSPPCQLSSAGVERETRAASCTPAQIFLIGTAHVSKASVEEVRSTIRRVQPATVLVELDAGRARNLRSGAQTSGTDLLKVCRNNIRG